MGPSRKSFLSEKGTNVAFCPWNKQVQLTGSSDSMAAADPRFECRSKRAGLNFPVGRVDRCLRAFLKEMFGGGAEDDDAVEWEGSGDNEVKEAKEAQEAQERAGDDADDDDADDGGDDDASDVENEDEDDDDDTDDDDTDGDGRVPRVGRGAPVYLAAVLEYLTAELMELSGNVARAAGRARIVPRDMQLAIRGDEELSKVLGGACVAVPDASGGASAGNNESSEQ